MVNPFIIMIVVDNFYLSEYKCISLSETNLKDKLLFTSRKEVYIKVNVVGSEEGTLTLRVLNYNETNVNEFKAQNFDLPVKFLKFEQLDWILLEPLLSNYRKNKLLPLCTNLVLPKPNKEWKDKTKVFSSEKYSPPDLSTTQNTKESFTKAIEEITFNDGFASFVHSIPGYSEPYTFKIENPDLRGEFNYIKGYFEKHFKAKKINITITISFLDSGTETTAVSPEISKINSEMIEAIKVNRILLLKNIDYTPEIEKTIFDEDELFELLDKDNKAKNIFEQTPEAIIDALINQNNIRNKEQLKYLSGEIQSDNEKIRFTLKPIFGFLFSTESNFKKHFVWELLNTNATYIWSVNNGLDFRLVEDELNTIRQIGRQSYRALDKKALESRGVEFGLVFHNLKSPDMGFERWKRDLQNFLI